MHFVQIRFSGSVSGVYRLWKFENLADFGPPVKAISSFFDFSNKSAPKIPAYLLRFLAAAPKPPGPAYHYITLVER